MLTCEPVREAGWNVRGNLSEPPLEATGRSTTGERTPWGRLNLLSGGAVVSFGILTLWENDLRPVHNTAKCLDGGYGV